MFHSIAKFMSVICQPAAKVATLPPLRLVTTSHTPDGTSVISSDTHLTPFHPFGPEASGFTVFHSADTIPISNTARLPPASTSAIPRPQPAGTIFCASDFPPHYSSPMHRTLTVDYCVVLCGSIWMMLDGGDETEIKAGEMILQSGVNHMWSNRADMPCRILFVMVGSEKVKLEDGRELDETKFGPPKN